MNEGRLTLVDVDVDVDGPEYGIERRQLPTVHVEPCRMHRQGRCRPLLGR